MLTLMMFTLVASDYRSFASTACAQADAGIESCCRAMEMSCCKPLAGPQSEEDCPCDILPVPAFPVDNEAPALTVTPGSRDVPSLSRSVQRFCVRFADIRSATRHRNSRTDTRTGSISSQDCAFLR